jgi:hypothetical protein
MRSALLRFWKSVSLSFAFLALTSAQSASQNGGGFSHNPQAKTLPTDSIIVQRAWSSASDSVTALPEGGTVADNVYTNRYFALTYPLPSGWTQKYSGPPPSDSGYYVLAQIRPQATNKITGRGTVLIAAQDLFFTLTPAANAFELIHYTEDQLPADYKLEQPLAPVTIARHAFVRLDYFSPVAELHWYVLATQIRCHAVQFVFTGADTTLMQNLIQDMNKMKLPAEASPILGTGGDEVPICIKDYARSENVIERVDPVFTERRYNPIPVRILIDKDGKVKHIHFLSAFPDQAKSITDALSQWRFKPYLRDGQPVEVETGIMFGQAQAPTPSPTDRMKE